MFHTRRPRPGLLGALVLALVLAVESSGLALAARFGQTESASAPVVDSAVGRVVPTGFGGLARAAGNESRTPEGRADRSPGAAMAAERLLGRSGSPHVRPTTNRGATTRPQLAAAPHVAAAGSMTNAYRGRNHVWIPELRINRAVAAFPCSRTMPPDNLVYRWGCAGTNNVYLLGHAYSVFAPLHDAYVDGRLHKGMEVVYADGEGRVRTYLVAWWRVTAPTSAASWAWAPQKHPSMTLQTCVGEDSAYRLIVRLVARS